MTGQEELQHLEAELTAGRISAEDYRARRDEILNRAESEHGGSPADSSPSGDPTGGNATSGNPTSGNAAPQNPFPPAFNWNATANRDSAAGEDAASEKATEFVLPLTGTPEAQGRAVHDPDSEPTRIVNVEQSAQRASEPQPARPNWQDWPPQAAPGPQQGMSAPAGGTPWTRSDLPPGHGNRSQARQGSEVFDTAGKSSRGKLIGGVVIGAVLVLGAAAAIGAYAVMSGDEPADDPGTAAPPPQQPPPPEPPPPEPQPPQPPPQAPPAPPQPPPQAPPGPQQPPAPAEPPPVKPPPATSQDVLVAPPPGPPHPLAGALDRPALEGPKGVLLSPEVRDFALQHGVVDGWFNGTDATTPKTTLLAVRMPDQNAAAGLAGAYRAGQADLAPADDLSYRGAEVLSNGNGTLRTAYVTHGWTVIVDVTGDQQAPSAELFQAVLDQQLAQSPPTVRQ